MSAIPICAGCSRPSGPYFATLRGINVELCLNCADRLLRGERKDDVIKTEQLKEVA